MLHGDDCGVATVWQIAVLVTCEAPFMTLTRL